MSWDLYSKPSDIKVGVIGYGGAFNMGKQHLSGMKAAGMRPFAVCEIDPSRLEVATTDFPGIETYGTLDAMLKGSEVDLIVHITPHNLHYSLAAKCLKAGKHVVTEKPFVLTTAEADKLIQLADKRRLLLSTYHNRHWDGWILRAKSHIVDKGVIGEVYRIEAAMGGHHMPRDWWRSCKSVSGGVMYDWGVHLLEYALQLIPSDLVEVSGYAKQGYWASQPGAKGAWTDDPNEDDAKLVARFSGGEAVEVNISHLSVGTDPYTVKVLGTQGAYLFHFREWTTKIRGRSGKLIEKSGPQPKSQGGKFYKNIADALCGKADLIITPQWARRPIHILDLASRSIAAGKAMPAKYA